MAHRVVKDFSFIQVVHNVFFFFFNLGFKGAGRGLIASDKLSIGEAALEIPESLIISEDLIFQSEMVCSTTINFFP